MIKDKHAVTPIFPGEQVALIEEFEGGKNTYITDGTIRSKAVGTRVYDFKRRIVKINPKNSPMLPKIGDVLVGYLEMLFGSMMSVRVLYINEKKSYAGFSAIASARTGSGGSNNSGGGGWRERGDRRSRTIFRVGDIIRGRVISLLNSTIHITIDEKEFGVLYTLCFNCGGDTVRVHNSVKCIECGVYEERKLTHDYGKETFRLIHNMQ
ncbi:MAG TPA: exosome complex RNA-binding protein Csl4 [Nitrososphaeraceae archaeon]|jgi:exosome complex component CSL4|nr:exosome complex RNA-binding protein Csl4 [Nitrososphaeraceae archaeon]